MVVMMNIPTPSSPAEAKTRLDVLIKKTGHLRRVPRPTFRAGWAALAYLHTGLHPDEVDNPEGGWPTELKRIGTEAWRRYHARAFSDDELYPSDAQWAGISYHLENRGRKQTQHQN